VWMWGAAGQQRQPPGVVHVQAEDVHHGVASSSQHALAGAPCHAEHGPARGHQLQEQVSDHNHAPCITSHAAAVVGRRCRNAAINQSPSAAPACTARCWGVTASGQEQPLARSSPLPGAAPCQEHPLPGAPPCQEHSPWPGAAPCQEHPLARSSPSQLGLPTCSSTPLSVHTPMLPSMLPLNSRLTDDANTRLVTAPLCTCWILSS
jgi:hypothetical protein